MTRHRKQQMMGTGGTAQWGRDAPLLQMTGVWFPVPTPETTAPHDPMCSSSFIRYLHSCTYPHTDTYPDTGFLNLEVQNDGKCLRHMIHPKYSLGQTTVHSNPPQNHGSCWGP